MTELTVHHLDNSRSQRILWLLEELGVDYDIEFYKRDEKTMRAPPELGRIHPLGRAPIVTIGDDIVLVESGAVIDELLDRYGKGRLRPEPGTEAYRRYRFWLHYAEGSLMPPLLVKLVVSRIRSAPVPFIVKPVAKGIASKVDEGFTDPEIKRHLTFIDSELGKHRWLAGDELTGADMQMSFPLEGAAARTDMGTKYPNIARYIEAIHARPAYQRGLERGGPFNILGRRA